MWNEGLKKLPVFYRYHHLAILNLIELLESVESKEVLVLALNICLLQYLEVKELVTESYSFGVPILSIINRCYLFKIYKSGAFIDTQKGL